MKPQEFVQAFAVAFGSETQLPIAFGFSDEPFYLLIIQKTTPDIWSGLCFPRGKAFRQGFKPR